MKEDPTPITKPTKPTMTVDYDRYAKMLNNNDLTEEQKKEFIDTLWNIIVDMIHLGIDVIPMDDRNEDKLQKVLKTDASNVIDLNHSKPSTTLKPSSQIHNRSENISDS